MRSCSIIEQNSTKYNEKDLLMENVKWIGLFCASLILSVVVMKCIIKKWGIVSVIVIIVLCIVVACFINSLSKYYVNLMTETKVQRLT